MYFLSYTYLPLQNLNLVSGKSEVIVDI